MKSRGIFLFGIVLATFVISGFLIFTYSGKQLLSLVPDELTDLARQYFDVMLVLMLFAVIGLGGITTFIVLSYRPEEISQQNKQRHHDYYIRLSRKGKLSEEDRLQFELAVLREQNGEVRPLPGD